MGREWKGLGVHIGAKRPPPAPGFTGHPSLEPGEVEGRGSRGGTGGGRAAPPLPPPPWVGARGRAPREPQPFPGGGPGGGSARLLPRQVRAARRNAAGLTHQRLLPTCRPAHKAVPSPPPPPAARPPSRPPSDRSDSLARCSRSRRAEPSAGAKVGPTWDSGKRQGRESSRGSRAARPCSAPDPRGWASILGPQRRGKDFECEPQPGQPRRGADGWAG
ncbi:proline-rich protein HaeIII subfamily 1-like [Phacochoerus africanus]|uniref:proline-rich protein HaeIII subfamily 1-like n=1 Tax=Phacochoerus africanus TaxID=41426 RepID=UPI001FDA9F94|nr:proline-rich protein HaeIII subfamily 1-like [Phacochoerus africanus]